MCGWGAKSDPGLHFLTSTRLRSCGSAMAEWQIFAYQEMSAIIEPKFISRFQKAIEHSLSDVRTVNVRRKKIKPYHAQGL